MCSKAKYSFIQDAVSETSFNWLCILASHVHLIQIFIELLKQFIYNVFIFYFFTGRVKSVHKKYLFVVQKMARAVAQCLLQVLKHLS